MERNSIRAKSRVLTEFCGTIIKVWYIFHNTIGYTKNIFFHYPFKNTDIIRFKKIIKYNNYDIKETEYCILAQEFDILKIYIK